MEVLSYRPEPAKLAWTFGGVPPVRRVRSGSYVSPQTGPFHVEGAMDTVLAVDLARGAATPWPRLESLRQLGRDHLASGGTGPR